MEKNNTVLVQDVTETGIVDVPMPGQGCNTESSSLGVHDVLLGSTLPTNCDTDSDTESISLLTGKPITPVTPYPDTPDFLANLGLSPMRPPVDESNWNLTNHDSDSDEDIIDPLYRYYESPICGGKYTMFLHYDDIIGKKCVVPLEKLNLNVTESTTGDKSARQTDKTETDNGKEVLKHKTPEMPADQEINSNTDTDVQMDTDAVIPEVTNAGTVALIENTTAPVKTVTHISETDNA